MTSEQKKEQIAALLSERQHYVAHDMKDRIAAVDASLAALGHSAKAPAARAQKMTAAKGAEL